MNKYISVETRHVAALILIRARRGIRPPAMRNPWTEDFIRQVDSDFPSDYVTFTRWWKNEEAQKKCSFGY